MKRHTTQCAHAPGGDEVAAAGALGATPTKEKFMLKRSPRIFTAMLLSLLLVCATALAVPATNAAAALDEPFDFSLRTVDGGGVSSQMLRGDVVVLAFGASWLPLSRAQVQGVQKLADEFGPRDVRVYWVSTDSESAKSKNYATDEQLRAFARKNGLKVAVLRDPEGTLFKQFGVAQNQLPSVIILDKSGGVAERIGGLNPEADLVAQLSARLNLLLQ